MRVLLVEDDPTLNAVAAAYLRRAGLAVDCARDAAGALRFTRLNPYDAIVLDLRLPDADGLAVCRALRANRVDARIIMATARDGLEDRIAGLDVGADDYLVKPYALAELEARLRALLRRPAAALPVTLTVGDLALDTATRRARRGHGDAARAIELTTKEFAVLEVLMRGAGRVVTRQQISEHAWDDSFDPFSNVIDVYVGRLRRKIDGAGERPLLATVRGAGWRLG
ncbi:MAG: response regulator transcription factor [Gemmatirosa sp.]|nr:response regulator transcription factor [Gemmatirosa sp.]